MPKITVLMPVYNAQKYLRRALDSILNQSFSDFELLVIDDFSIDESRKILSEYKDSRLKLVFNDSNLGVARTLNKGLDLANGEYIARMDADDLSDSTRFEKQIIYLTNNPDLGIIGSFVRYFNNSKSYVLRYPQGSDCIRAFILFGNPIAHPSVMLRNAMFKKHGLKYDEKCGAAQDYELWRRSTLRFDFDNIPEPLVSWRDTENRITRSRFSESNQQAFVIQKQELFKLGISVSGAELQFHREVGNGSGFSSLEELRKASDWLTTLIEINNQKTVYSKKGFLQAAAFCWFRSCLNSSGLGIDVLKMYWHSPFRKYYSPGYKEFSEMVINAIIRFRKESVGKTGS